MTRLAPVEKTTRYSTMVESLSEAFAFVMEHLDELGEESPLVSIIPISIHNDDGTDPVEAFEVSVSNMKETP